MRYELTDNEWAAIKPFLPNKPRGVLASPDHPGVGRAEFRFDFWVGAFVPKQTPNDIVAKIHRETTATIQSAAIQEKLAKLGVEPMNHAAGGFRRAPRPRGRHRGEARQGRQYYVAMRIAD